MWSTLTTNAARTAVDVARTLTRLDALATLDAALRAGVSSTALTAELEKQAGRRGRRQAAQLIGLADVRAESPMESRTRLRCIDAGLPPPEPQIEVQTRNGLRRIDLGWRRRRIGLEYDSTVWHRGKPRRAVTTPATTGSAPKAGPSTTPRRPTSTTTRTTSPPRSGTPSVEGSEMVAVGAWCTTISLRSTDHVPLTCWYRSLWRGASGRLTT